MTLAARLASMPDNALVALSHGLRSGGLSLESSAAAIAGKLGLEPATAATFRNAMRDSGTADSSSIALAAEAALESRRASRETSLSSIVELVLSGPIVEGVEMRDTAVVFSSLLQDAREEVLVTSFVAGYARELLAPLADFLDADPTRRATIVLNFQRGSDTTITSDLAARLADEFWTKQWPRGARRPTLCYDPRGLEMEREARATMHAKVVVIDRRKAFVTSANLTARAQSQNIELGVLVNHAPTAARIAGYFEALIASRLLENA